MPKFTTKSKQKSRSQMMQEIRDNHRRELLSVIGDWVDEEPEKPAPPPIPQHKIDERLQDNARILLRMPQPKESVSGQIYAVRQGRTPFYKIGCLMSAEKMMRQRLEALQIGNPLPLSIVLLINCEYPVKVETMLHDKFESKWVRGEWFKLSAADIALIPELISNFTASVLPFIESNTFKTADGG